MIYNNMQFLPMFEFGKFLHLKVLGSLGGLENFFGSVRFVTVGEREEMKIFKHISTYFTD